MNNLNQIFYLMFAVFALGIALNAYADFRNQKIRSDIKVYWIVAMTLIVISSISYAIGSFGLPLFLFLGSAFFSLFFADGKLPIPQHQPAPHSAVDRW